MGKILLGRLSKALSEAPQACLCKYRPATFKLAMKADSDLIQVKTDRLIEDDHLWTTEGHLKGQPTLQDEMEEGVFIGKIV
jgi:hypothetical protein